MIGSTQYLDDPRKLGAAPGGVAGDPARAEWLRRMFGGASADEVPAPPPAALGAADVPPIPQDAPTPAPQTTQTQPVVAAPAPAAPAPVGGDVSAPPPAAPGGFWHGLQGFAAGFAGPEYARQFQERDRAAMAAQVAARAEDPNSPESVRARTAAMPFLRAAGFRDADIAGMSAEDITSAGGMKALIAQAAARQRETDKARIADDQFYKHQEFVGNTPEQKLERAQAIGGQQQAAQAAARKEQQDFSQEAQARQFAHAEQMAESADARRQAAEDRAEQRRIEREQRMAQAKTKAAADLYDNYQRANPYLDFKDPDLLASAYASRGKVKLSTDLQDASVLYRASTDLEKIREQAADAAARGDLKHAYALNEKYHLAVNKAADALVRLGGNASEGAKRQALAKFPSIANPFGGEVLHELQDELNNVIDSKIGSAYGGTVRRDYHPEDNLGTAPAPKVPGAKAAPKPAAAPAARSNAPTAGMSRGVLRLSDGSEADDTPENRAIIEKAGLQYEVEGAAEDAAEPGEE